MKICILTGIFPPDIGGPATYVERLAQEFSGRNIGVKVITYANSLNFRGKYNFSLFCISHRYPKIIRHFLYLWQALRLARDCSVIYAQNLFSAGIPGLIADKILRKKLVVKIVGDYAWEQSLMRGWFSGGIDEFQKAKSLKINLFKKIQKILALKANTIIVPSNYLKSIVSGWGVPENKIRVIYNAVESLLDLDIQKQVAKKKIGIEGDIILSIGRLAPWKGFNTLIDVFPDLLRENPEFKLIIVGEGEERKNLESRIKNSELEDSVRLLGKVNHQDIPFYFKAADVFILNSEYEGLSHVILEAMHFGSLVIASNKGGNPELIQDGFNGFLVEYSNKEQIKNAILRLCLDKNLQEKFIQNSKEKLKEFTWESLIEKTLRVLSGNQSTSNMKKVLFIGVTNYNLENEQASSHLRKKFEGLSRGVKPYVLARGRSFHKKIWDTEFYLLPRGTFFWPLAFFLGFYLCLAKKIDTIVVQSPLLEGLVGTALKRFLKKELIVEVHGDWIDGPFLSKKRKLESLERKIVPILAKISFRNANKIRAISSYTKEEAFKISGPKPYFIFPTFTDIDMFLNEKDIKLENFILFIGQLEKVKGVDILIDAFSKIEKDFPEFKLVLIGEGSEKKNLESRIKNLELENRVEFKGRLSLEETKNVMKNCYCLVLPSLSEGLGRVLMEAQAMEKPVIGSNVGGIPDLIKDNQNGFLFEKGNSSDLADKLRILLRNKNLAREMGQKGREFVKERFSNQNYIKSYFEMINS